MSRLTARDHIEDAQHFAISMARCGLLPDDDWSITARIKTDYGSNGEPLSHSGTIYIKHNGEVYLSVRTESSHYGLDSDLQDALAERLGKLAPLAVTDA